MLDDHDAVPREVDVELEAVGAKCKTVIEGENRVLGPERGSAAVRKNYRHGRYWFKGFKGFKGSGFWVQKVLGSKGCWLEPGTLNREP
jgi:hypothetical protein